jgi:hypothetical protein
MATPPNREVAATYTKTLLTVAGSPPPISVAIKSIIITGLY